MQVDSLCPLKAMRISLALCELCKNNYWHSRTRFDEAKISFPDGAKHFYLPVLKSDEIETDKICVEFVVTADNVDGSCPRDYKPLEDALREAAIIKSENEHLRGRIKILEAALENSGVSLATKPKHPYADAVRDYLSALKLRGGHKGHKCSPTHLKTRERHLQDFWPEKSKFEHLEDITLEVAMKVADDLLLKGKSGKTVHTHLESLRALLAWAMKLKMIDENPLKEMPPINTKPKDERRALSELEVAKLLAVIPADRRLLYETAICTGYRKGELMALKVRDLRDDGLALGSSATKNKLAAFQPVPAFLVADLKAACAGRAGDEPLLHVDVHADRRFKKDLTLAKIPDEKALCFHSLRHTCATLLSAAGVPQRDCQTLMRHSDPKLTANVYSHSSVVGLRSGVEAVGRAIRPASAS